jgi:hypothetical protein
MASTSSSVAFLVILTGVPGAGAGAGSTDLTTDAIAARSGTETTAGSGSSEMVLSIHMDPGTEVEKETGRGIQREKGTGTGTGRGTEKETGTGDGMIGMMLHTIMTGRVMAGAAGIEVMNLAELQTGAAPGMTERAPRSRRRSRLGSSSRSSRTEIIMSSAMQPASKSSGS